MEVGIVPPGAVNREIKVAGLDGLVNAAGIAGGQSLIDTDMAHWRRLLELNDTGAMFVARTALPFLAEAH